MNIQQPWFYLSLIVLNIVSVESNHNRLLLLKTVLLKAGLLTALLLQLILTQGYAAKINKGVQQQSEQLSESRAQQLPDMSLLLEIVINGRATNKIVSVEYRQGHYYLLSDDIKALGLPLVLPEKREIALDTLPDITVEYDSARQQLHLGVPANWLPEQQLTARNQALPGMPESEITAEGNTGFLLNYDLYSTYQFQTDTVDSVSAWTEQRLFGRYGALVNTGNYYQSFTSKSNRYTRFETSWQLEDEQRMLQYNVGDIITAPLDWGHAVWMGGISVSRNFTLRPDLITYPLPAFKGQAALPSTVDLFINDYQQMSSSLHPGPFSLATVPTINGAGTATMTVTDMQGKQVVVNVPFYVATELLAEGLTDFNFSAGKLRKNYGIKNFSYGEDAASGMIRYGMNNALTLQSRMETGKNLVNGGAGAALQLWNFGVLEGGYSASRAPEKSDLEKMQVLNDTGFSEQSEFATGEKAQGYQNAFGYSYNGRYFSLNGRRVLNSTNYSDLGSYSSNLGQFRRQDQAALSISMDKWGSMGVSYIGMYNSSRLNNRQESRFRLLGLNYSKGLWGDSSFYISANREIGNRGYNGNLMFTMPFQQESYITFNSTRDRDNQWSNTLYYAKNTPTEGGLGGNLAVGRSGSRYSQQSRLEYAHRNFIAQGGIYGDKYYTGWAELQGAVVLMDGNAYASRPIYDAFTLISTDGYVDIPVTYENQPMGNTDAEGYLLIPYVTSYYNAKYAIDPLHLPADMDVPVVEQRKMTRSNQGSMVNFKVGKSSAITVVLVDSAGDPLPVGSRVRVLGTDYISYVGWEGETYLEKVSAVNRLQVQRIDNNKRCQVVFSDTALQGNQVNRIVCSGEEE